MSGTSKLEVGQVWADTQFGGEFKIIELTDTFVKCMVMVGNSGLKIGEEFTCDRSRESLLLSSPFYRLVRLEILN